MGRIHFQVDLTSGADNRQAELGRKAVALYNVYFSNISNAPGLSFEQLIDDILNDKRKVITDYDLFLKRFGKMSPNDHVVKMHQPSEPKSVSNLAPWISSDKTTPIPSNVEKSEASPSNDVTPSSVTARSGETMDTNKAPTVNTPGETATPLNTSGETATPRLIGGGSTATETHHNIFNGTWPAGTVIMPDVIIGKHFVVGNDVHIKNGVKIGDNVTISDDVEILSGMTIPPKTFVIGKIDTSLLLDMMDDFKTMSGLDEETLKSKVDALLQSNAE